MSKPLNILISGSGIAGSVLTFWLLRAHPTATITIIERDPSLRLTGASVDIRDAAVDIIKLMGVEPEIRSKCTNESGIQFVNSNGKAFATLGASGRSDVQSITSEYEIFRGVLAQIFIDRVISNPRVKLIFGESVSHFEDLDDGNKVAVTFTTSKETKVYDLLVAADGLGSRIRGMMLKTKPSEQLFDEGVHVAYFTMSPDLLNGSRFAKYYNAPGGRVVFLRPDPAGQTRAMFLNITTTNDVEGKARLNKAWGEGNEAYMQLMEEMYSDAGWLAPEVLKGMRQASDFYCSLFGQIRCPTLHSNRVVLLGDAGYATPGFGTSLAIIGGYVLAGELLRAPGDVKTALKKYENIMLPFVKSSQGGDQAMQYLNPQTQWGIGVRNAVLGFVTKLKLDRMAMASASALGLAGKKLKMSDYEWPGAAEGVVVGSV